MDSIIIPSKITPELAEETGWHIGDGSMNFYKYKDTKRGLYSLRGHIIDDVEHYNKRIKPVFKKIYNLDVSLRFNKSTGVYGFQKWSDKLIEFKSKILSLPLGKKKSIEIPEIFLKNKEMVISVIRGIFDTDGCLYLEKRKEKLYPRISIATISEALGKQLHRLTLTLGIRATIRFSPRKTPGWSDQFIIDVRGNNETKKWFKIIKPQNPKFINRYNYFLSNS